MRQFQRRHRERRQLLEVKEHTNRISKDFMDRVLICSFSQKKLDHVFFYKAHRNIGIEQGLSTRFIEKCWITYICMYTGTCMINVWNRLLSSEWIWNDQSDQLKGRKFLKITFYTYMQYISVLGSLNLSTIIVVWIRAIWGVH